MSNKAENVEFLVTARKFRPNLFSDVVGQEHVSRTLKNAISGNRIHHAYLFCGPRGVGKTTSARIYARAVNCENPKDGEPCNECDSCNAILSGRSLDVIEIDGASNNSVEDIRKLRENAKYPPSSGKHKIYIIDEVHMLSTSAFNALLKTLEEPPPHLLFVFATTESHKVPATIISRCQRFDFRRMEIKDIVNQLTFIAQKESITIDHESLISIAKKADGSMRDSQSIFDQVVAFCGKDINYKEMASALHLIDEELFFRISSAIYEKDATTMLEIANAINDKGYDLREALQGLLEHFRNITLVKITNSTDLIETSESMKQSYLETASYFTQNDLIRLMTITSNFDKDLRHSPQPRIKFELALLQMSSIDSTLQLQQLLNQIDELKKKA